MSIEDHKIIISSILRMGLPQTLNLVGICLTLSLPIGIFLGIIRSFRVPGLDNILAAYASISRGIPTMIILLYVYTVLPIRTPFWTAVFALVFAESAYIMEIMKGALFSINKGQLEAASALSLPTPYTIIRIILPQVLLFSLPAIFGQMVLLLKGTAVASIVGVIELTKQGQFLLSSYSQPLIVYGYVLIIFFVLCHTLTSISKIIENKIKRQIIGDTND